MRRIGLYSGTFDPVHTGHVALARAALSHAELDLVAMLPEQKPWGKNTVTAYKHRVAMLQLAINQHRHISVAAMPSERFTIAATLPLLGATYPDDKLFFIFGSDVFLQLAENPWADIDLLLGAAELVIGLRRPNEAEAVHQAARKLQAACKQRLNYQLVISGLPTVSSTQIRSSLQAKTQLKGLVEPVRHYIQEHNLYE